MQGNVPGPRLLLTQPRRSGASSLAEKKGQFPGLWLKQFGERWVQLLSREGLEKKQLGARSKRKDNQATLSIYEILLPGHPLLSLLPDLPLLSLLSFPKLNGNVLKASSHEISRAISSSSLPKRQPERLTVHPCLEGSPSPLLDKAPKMPAMLSGYPSCLHAHQEPPLRALHLFTRHSSSPTTQGVVHRPAVPHLLGASHKCRVPGSMSGGHLNQLPNLRAH